MTNETLRDFVVRREGELRDLLTAARGTVASLEQELAQVEQTKRTLVADPANALDAIPRANSNATVWFESVPAIGQLLTNAAAENMTIKQLVVKALRDRYPAGTTAMDLRDFMRNAYRRTVEPSSLRPQLSRLKADGWIEQNPSNDEWKLTKAALIYTHPSSINTKDEPSEEVVRLQRLMMGQVEQPAFEKKLGELLNPKPKK